MPYFERDNLRFHYLDSGEGLPFIFQHGLGGDTNQTAEVFQPPQPGVRFISMDCRGHGETRPLGDPDKIKFDTFADDVVALMDYLGMMSAVVGGISMGAGVSLNLALRHPARVRGLIVSRPAWLDQPLPDNLRIFPQVANYIRQYGAQEGLGRFRQSPEFTALQREAPDVANSAITQFENPRAEDSIARLERIPQDAPSHNRAEWSTITLPVLVLANRVDPVHPFEYGAVIAAAIPGATLREIPSKSIDKAQHFIVARRHIKAFLEQLSMTTNFTKKG